MEEVVTHYVHTYIYTCISVYNVQVYAGGLRVYVLVVHVLYVSKLWGKNLNI